MTWSSTDAIEQRKKAYRCLLNVSGGHYTRSLEWRDQQSTGVPDGVWSLLFAGGLVAGNVIGGPKWRLTVSGWIEACGFLREEIGLDERFGRFAGYLKAMGGRSGADTSTRAIAEATGIAEEWVFDAIDGQMAEFVYGQHGPILLDRMGGVEVPAHIGNKK
jgi:hypothetical protein